jgi:hypothetical protein
MGNNIPACELRSSELLSSIKKNKSVMARYSFMSRHSFAFRLKLKKPFTSLIRIEAVSCSVSPDSMGNRGEEYNEGIPNNLEIALVGKNNKLTYDEKLGYRDVCNFFSDEDIIIELLRIASFAKREKVVKRKRFHLSKNNRSMNMKLRRFTKRI